MSDGASNIPGSVWGQKWYVVVGAVGAATFLGGAFGFAQGDLFTYRLGGAAAMCFSFAESEIRTFRQVVVPGGIITAPARNVTFLGGVLYIAAVVLGAVAAYRTLFN